MSVCMHAADACTWLAGVLTMRQQQRMPDAVAANLTDVSLCDVAPW
jgi:hypothetical protein